MSAAIARARKLTPQQKRVVQEIQRVAEYLGRRSVSQDEFDRLHTLAGVSTAGYQFGSWNEAVAAAGLEPIPSGKSNRHGPKYSDRELLEEIIRLHRQDGEPPTERRMTRFGRYSVKPYRERWGTFAKAREAAYALLGTPE